MDVCLPGSERLDAYSIRLGADEVCRYKTDQERLFGTGAEGNRPAINVGILSPAREIQKTFKPGFRSFLLG